MVADRLATPAASAVAVPSSTGSEFRVTVTADPATKVCATMSMVWPGVGVVSLTVKLFSAGGYCWAAAGAAKSTSATAAATTTRFTICPSPALPHGGTRPQPFLSVGDPNTSALPHKRSPAVSSRIINPRAVAVAVRPRESLR